MAKLFKPLSFRPFLWAILGASSGIISPSPSHAVQVAGGDGTQNNTSTGAGGGWSYVGSINAGNPGISTDDASGIYLGNYSGGYWVLTANHVGGGTFTLNGVSYNMVSGSGQQVAGVDLYLFRIEVPAEDTTVLTLQNLGLSTTNPVSGSSVTMIGYGLNRAVATTTYYVDVDQNPYTWSTSVFPGFDATATGYQSLSTSSKRWGSNTVESTINSGGTVYVTTNFDSVAGEAQAALGDSGGGMFTFNGSSWELSGVIDLVGTYSGQPQNTSVFGNATYAISVAQYRSQIMAAVPEPQTVALLALGMLSLGCAIRRKNRRASLSL